MEISKKNKLEENKKESDKKKNGDNVRKKVKLVILENVGFCNDCGNKINDLLSLNDEYKCDICGNVDKENILKGEIAKKLNAYLLLSHDGLLKKYARSMKVPYKKKSSSNKKIIWDLLIKVDGLYNENDKNGFELIQKKE